MARDRFTEDRPCAAITTSSRPRFRDINGRRARADYYNRTGVYIYIYAACVFIPLPVQLGQNDKIAFYHMRYVYLLVFNPSLPPLPLG